MAGEYKFPRQIRIKVVLMKISILRSLSAVLLILLFLESALAGKILVTRSDESSQTLQVIGNIDPELTTSLLNLKSNPAFSYRKKTTFIFDNPGGYVESGAYLPIFILDLSFKIKDGSGSSLLVRIERECHSMCIFVFNAVANMNKEDIDIEVSRHALFGFHAASVGNAVHRGATEYYIDKLLLYGASPEWISDNRWMFNRRSVTYVSAEKLADENSGIVEHEYLN